MNLKLNVLKRMVGAAVVASLAWSAPAAIASERSGGPAPSQRTDLSMPRQKLVKNAIQLAEDLKAEAVIVFTVRGNMARHAASFRPFHPRIYAMCESESVARSLALIWGVQSFVLPFNHARPEENIEQALDYMATHNHLAKGTQVVIISSITAGDQIVDVVEMRVV